MNKETKFKGLYCRECHKLMKSFKAMDMSGILGKELFYCNNNKCKRFGDLTLVGLGEK